MMSDRISVVMACYSGDRAEPLRSAIDSILNQTIHPEDFVIVVDGPVGSDIAEVLDCAQVNNGKDL